VENLEEDKELLAEEVVEVCQPYFKWMR